MTTVTLCAERLCAKGHAQYANAGEDIVCAAISVLCETLAESLYQYATEGVLQDIVTIVEPGNVKLKWKLRRDSPEFSGTIRAIQIGLSLLAESYPENVQFEDLS